MRDTRTHLLASRRGEKRELSIKRTGEERAEVAPNTKGLALFLKGSSVLTAIRKFSCNFTPHSYRTLSHLQQETGAELGEPEYNRSLWLWCTAAININLS